MGEAADAGDALAVEIMDRARRAFAAFLVGLVDVFAPERIVVGGSLAEAEGARLLGPAREAVAAVGFRIPRERVSIVPAALGDDVRPIGALPLLARRRLPQGPSDPTFDPPATGSIVAGQRRRRGPLLDPARTNPCSTRGRTSPTIIDRQAPRWRFPPCQSASASTASAASAANP